MAVEMKGLEWLFNGEKDNFISKDDAIIILLHCYLINNNCKCVGTGDEWEGGTSTASEMLPEHWNNNQDIYSLRYLSRKQERYLLKVVRANPFLLINFVDVDKGNVSGTSIRTEDFVNDSYREFNETYKNLNPFQKKLKEELLMKVGFFKSSTAILQKESPSKFEDPDPSRVQGPSYRNQPEPDMFNDPFEYGRADLDPFGRGSGGGMIFNPHQPRMPGENPSIGIPGRLPRGARPPGARFDPFGPPHPDILPRFRGPDPDNILPPPEYDDIFS